MVLFFSSLTQTYLYLYYAPGLSFSRVPGYVAVHWHVSVFWNMPVTSADLYRPPIFYENQSDGRKGSSES